MMDGDVSQPFPWVTAATSAVIGGVAVGLSLSIAPRILDSVMSLGVFFLMVLIFHRAVESWKGRIGVRGLPPSGVGVIYVGVLGGMLLLVGERQVDIPIGSMDLALASGAGLAYAMIAGIEWLLAQRRLARSADEGPVTG